MGGGHPLPYPPPAYFGFSLKHAPAKGRHIAITLSILSVYPSGQISYIIFGMWNECIFRSRSVRFQCWVHMTLTFGLRSRINCLTMVSQKHILSDLYYFEVGIPNISIWVPDDLASRLYIFLLYIFFHAQLNLADNELYAAHKLAF